MPDPWVVEEDDSGEISFWNEFYVEDGKQVGKRQVEVPTELPPCNWPYVARRGADGSWEYVNVERPKDVRRDLVPRAPEGCAVDWSGGQQSWFWWNCATGEATLNPPEEKRMATRSRESLVRQLEEADVLASGTVLTKRIVKKQYLRQKSLIYRKKC